MKELFKKQKEQEIKLTPKTIITNIILKRCADVTTTEASDCADYILEYLEKQRGKK